MKAAVVESAGAAPRYEDFHEPSPSDGVVIVDVVASALSQLTKARASGKHYSSSTRYPFVPGVDGVGTYAGRRVYFMLPESPFGGMAERVAVRTDRLVDIPDAVDDVTAAAIANPGMSSWAALTERADLKRGEAVLINGATGTAGRLALRIARHLGAGRVVATGRNATVLAQLRAEGIDETIELDSPRAEFDASLARTFKLGIDVVIDYLWGVSAEAIIAAAATDPSRSVRFVNVGSTSGETIAMPASALRSSRVVCMGSGLGSISLSRFLTSIDGVFKAVIPAGLNVRTVTAPLTDVASSWNADGPERLVFMTKGIPS